MVLLGAGFEVEAVGFVFDAGEGCGQRVMGKVEE